MKHVAILGAGISGLSAAFFLKKMMPQGVKLTIYEKQSKAGGWIQSIEKNGFIFERGPHALRFTGKGATTYSLIEQLGLQSELVHIPSKSSQRYILQKQQLKKISPLFLLRLGIVQAALRQLLYKKTHQEITVKEYCMEFFGKKIAENLMDPFVRGIFGGDYATLSLQAALPHLAEKNLLKLFLERPSPLFSFKRGMQTLPNRLAEILEPHIEQKTITSFEEIDADHIICALPPSFFPTLPTQTITTVNCGWSKPLSLPQGFGYLVPAHEHERILGVIFASPAHLRIMMQGAPSDALTIALDAVRRHLHIEETPSCTDIHTAYHAIPQYTLGHHERLKQFNAPRISFIGSYINGIGVNDCIHLSFETAKTIARMA